MRQRRPGERANLYGLSLKEIEIEDRHRPARPAHGSRRVGDSFANFTIRLESASADMGGDAGVPVTEIALHEESFRGSKLLGEAHRAHELLDLGRQDGSGTLTHASDARQRL